jgi:hypothetical protein
MMAGEDLGEDTFSEGGRGKITKGRNTEMHLEWGQEWGWMDGWERKDARDFDFQFKNNSRSGGGVVVKRRSIHSLEKNPSLK